MKFATSATRMELLKLKKRITLARRGHKLLRDKQDELMRRFMLLIDEWEALRKEVGASLSASLMDFTIGQALAGEDFSQEAIASFKKPAEIEYSSVRFLNLNTPRFKISAEEKTLNYNLLNTNSKLDVSLNSIYGLFPKLIKLAELETSILLLSNEIKSTRRRVNALEYILIPGLIETVKYINMKLGEFERSNLTRLMRVKELIRSH